MRRRLSALSAPATLRAFHVARAIASPRECACRPRGRHAVLGEEPLERAAVEARHRLTMVRRVIGIISMQLRRVDAACIYV